MIENYFCTSHSSSYVLNIICDFHIYKNVKELKRSRRLRNGKVDLNIGNGVRVVALAVKTYYLTFCNELILELDNCYIIIVLFRNIISIFYLALNACNFIIEGKYCSFHNNNAYYRLGIFINDLYIFYLEMLLFNINSKKNKLYNQYSSYL